MSKREIIKDTNWLAELAPVTKAKIARQVLVCNGKSCSALGSAEVKQAFAEELESRKLRWGRESKGRNPKGTVMLTDCGSVDFCKIGTAVLVYPDGVWYAQVQKEDVREIVERHIEGGEIVQRLALVNVPYGSADED